MPSARPRARRSATKGPRASIILGAGLSVAALLACKPALDWREVRRAGDPVTALFPCRPETQQRTVTLGQRQLPMRLEACAATGLGFSLAVLEVPNGGEAATLREELRRQMIGNVDGIAQAGAPLPSIGVAGSAPLAWRIAGRWPDGRPVLEDAVYFAHGARLYQAAVVSGPEADAAQRAAAVETFFASLRVQ